MAPSGWLDTGDAVKVLEPCVSLTRPWLLPGLTAGEWEEKGWLHAAQSARKPPNGRANAGQVIWRLGCIKAIYKGLKDLRRCTHWVLHFLYDLAPDCCVLWPSQSIRKGNKKCCLYGGLAFFLFSCGGKRFLWLAPDAWCEGKHTRLHKILCTLSCTRTTHTHTRHIHNQGTNKVAIQI